MDIDDEVSRQRAILRDLVALSAIPAAWTGMDPPAVAKGLADELTGLLELDFVFVRLCDPDGAEPAEVTRGEAWNGFSEWLEGHPAPRQLLNKQTFSDVRGSEPCRVIAMQIGVNGAGGVVAAARERSEFPTATDELLLSLAANQAATAFQGARLIQERRRAEAELREARNELEVKVTERTAELRRSEAHLAQLAGEQAALRRVATLVAHECSEAEVFTAIADGIAELLGADEIRMFRFEGDGSAVVVAESGERKQYLAAGSRHRLEGENVASRIARTGRPARIDDYKVAASGPIAEVVHSTDIRGVVGVPILVEGRLWGAMLTSTSGEEPFPAETESRLGQFTELMATAIANADARDQLTASRARLLTAGDEARRRVVRDLHDGAQQRLVQATVILKLAQEAMVERDRREGSLVDEALEQVEQGNTELRELAHGILPTSLAHGGLREAIGSIVARLGLPVEVDVPRERFPAEIEASTYFIVAEALTNVVKHAKAEGSDVRVFVEDGTLRIEIRDDGIGGADPGGNGLVGMDDRVTALGGRLRIESQAGDGTLVVATLPLTGR